MKVGEALITVRDKFINYISSLTKIENKYTIEHLNTINEAIGTVKDMGLESLITYISMYVAPSVNNIDLYIRSRISSEFLDRLTQDEYTKVKRYICCMVDLVSSK
jgi:hypothetical protein